jgi:hypothetical protein
MPTSQATVATRGMKINIKPRPETQRRKEYMNHVHAIAFRLIGEIFASLPTVQHVVISGFSQRSNRATGQVSDEYLFSVRVQRSEWINLNFNNLQTLDLPTCLGSFDIRRNMTKNV